uniref:Uncharacterized protein n=1 Tax=Siphoviridae sp. ctTIi48 TaxID=2827875 RepID=A0A8S5TLF7_9CAUD|nr:MAG TPA: hypothetical protein [Siphoviridae sp. ctTIi48]
MLDLSFLSQRDIAALDKKIGFTEDEKIIINHLARNDMTDDGIMFELSINRNRFYKIKTNLINKIIREAIQS